MSKTITFDSIAVPINSCYLNTDPFPNPEDPAIVIDCVDGKRLFAAEWPVPLQVFGNHSLGNVWSGCNYGSSFTINPFDTSNGNTLQVYVQTMEGDDPDCNNNAGGNDDCVATDTIFLSLLNGINSLTVGQITFHYSVSESISGAELGKDTILCMGDSLLLDAGIQNASYLWQNNSTASTFLVNQPGLYWVKVDRPNICEPIWDTMQVTYANRVSNFLGQDTALCVNDSLKLDASGGATAYLWQDGSANQNFYAKAPGVYWVEVVSALGCIYTDTITIFQHPAPIVNLGEDTTICNGQVLELNVTQSNCTYIWQDGSSNSIFYATTAGKYWVIVINAQGCKASDTIEVFMENSQVLNLGSDTTICIGETLLLDVSHINGTYTWNDQNADPFYPVFNEGSYWVEIETNCGLLSDTINVILENCDCRVFIASSFTPNSDGLNDYFQPTMNCTPTEYKLYILNRWGNIVFFSTNPDESWNGGQNPEAGVFSYRIELRFGEARQYRETGTLTLLK